MAQSNKSRKGHNNNFIRQAMKLTIKLTGKLQQEILNLTQSQCLNRKRNTYTFSYNSPKSFATVIPGSPNSCVSKSGPLKI